MKQNHISPKMKALLMLLLTSTLTLSAGTPFFKKDNQYVVKIKISTSGLYSHNLNGFIGSIDWGDGSTSQYEDAVNNPEHPYEKPGEYIITAQGKAQQLDSNFASKVITDVIHIGGDMGIKRMDYAFAGQRNLTTLREGIFDELKDVRSFYFTFGMLNDNEEAPGYVTNKNSSKNHGITSIPDGLFDKCKKVRDFGCTFFGCKIKSIPTGLFRENKKVWNFGATFCYTDIENIPPGLFDQTPSVENFKYTFFDCRNLKGRSPFALLIDSTGTWVRVFLYDRNQYPPYYIAPTSYQGCFGHCSGLEDFSKIPDTWK